MVTISLCDLNKCDEFDKLYEIMSNLPFDIEKDIMYLDNLKLLLNDYVVILKTINEDTCSFLIDTEGIENICSKIIKAIECYYNGNLEMALASTKELFDKKNVGGKLFYCDMKSDCSDKGQEQFTRKLYRSRKGRDIWNLGDMFHIPYNKREIISTKRYSIPGYPCLYLSGSIYGAWTESGKPSFNEFNISRFEVRKDLKVLDLSFSAHEIFNPVSEYSVYLPKLDINEITNRYLYTWPLICACSFTIKEQSRNFKSEYIFPQLLLQVIRNYDSTSDMMKIDGIKYFSCQNKYDYKVRPNPIYTNYVFISDDMSLIDINKNQYSRDLCEKFYLTPPVVVSTALSLSEAGRCGIMGKDNYTEHMLDEMKDGSSRYIKEDGGIRSKSLIEILKGYLVQYGDMDFYRIEQLLCRIPGEEMK